MRYSQHDYILITEIFETGDTVTIDIINVDADSLAVTGATCTELTNMPGVFKYKFSPVVGSETVFAYKMDNGNYTKYGKFVFGGYIDTTVEDSNNKITNDVAKKTDVYNAALI